MQISLTLTGTASQLAAVLASLDGCYDGGAIAVRTDPDVFTPLPMPAAAAADDGDEGAVDANAPSLDIDGLPWDERIHAKTKVRTQDGKWRKRRNVTDMTVAAVEAELRGASMAAMPVAAVTPPMPIEPAPPPPMPPVEPVAAVAPPPPIPVAPPPAPPMPVEAVAPAPIATPPASEPEHLDFAQFMQHISNQMTKRDVAGAPMINTDVLAALASEISTAFINAGHIATALTSITDIATNQQMVDYAIALLKRDGRW